MLTLVVHLTEEDLVNFNYLHWNFPENSSNRLQYFLRSVVSACFAVSLIILLKASYGDRVTIKDLAIIASVGFLFAIVFAFVLIKTNIQRQVGKLISDPRNMNILKRHEVVINNSGMEWTDDVSKLFYKWTAITKYTESKDYFLFYTDSVHAIIIPKKVLHEDELKKLKQMITENISLSLQLNER